MDHDERLSDTQHKMLDEMERLGLNDPERLRILSDIVKGAAAWGYLKKWLIQTAAVMGAGGALWAVVELLRKNGGS